MTLFPPIPSPRTEHKRPEKAMRSTITVMLISLTAAPAMSAEPEPLLPKVRAAVQPEIDQHRAEHQAATMQELAKADSVPALFKPPLRQKAVTDPWGALTELE